MASTVSYANIAANGGSHETSPVRSPVSASAENDADTKEVPEAESTSAAKSDSSSGTVAAAAAATAAAAPTPAKKEKKVLAPAPVPTKSAWGAAAASVPVSNGKVDGQKWPTPESHASGSVPETSATKTKFIKPVTNKWVPINAKVSLSTPRANSSNSNTNSTSPNQKNRRKNNKNKKKTQESSVTKGSIPKGETSGDDEKIKPKKEAEAEDLKPETKSEDEIVPVDAETAPLDSESEDASESRLNGQTQKNYRRFNQEFKPRHNQQQQQPQPQQQQPPIGAIPQNGFYHPQAFVPNPQHFHSNNYNANGNRQFRPQNGQYRRSFNNGNYNNGNRNNGTYRNGSIGNGAFIPNQFQPQFQHLPPHIPQFLPHQPQQIIPAQIPPPISPKQDPKHALTQQINYYFSFENLIRDIFLRKNMTLKNQGWIDLQLILDFKRVKIIINGIHNSLEETDEVKKLGELNAIIIDAVQHCDNLEILYADGSKEIDETSNIADIKLRVNKNYEQWVLPDSV